MTQMFKVKKKKLNKKMEEKYMRRIRNSLVGLLLIGLLLGGTVIQRTEARAVSDLRSSTYAASMTAACPQCGRHVNSYGVMERFTETSQTLHAGEMCAGCHDIVASGKIHEYTIYQDRYSFWCSCGRQFMRLSEEKLASHTIRKATK